MQLVLKETGIASNIHIYYDVRPWDWRASSTYELREEISAQTLRNTADKYRISEPVFWWPNPKGK